MFKLTIAQKAKIDPIWSPCSIFTFPSNGPGLLGLSTSGQVCHTQVTNETDNVRHPEAGFLFRP
jgi:hypothetical protein